jgi:hypothetical protein
MTSIPKRMGNLEDLEPRTMGDSVQGSDIVMDFLGDFRLICEKALTSLGVRTAAPDDVVYLYFATLRRRVEARPYRVIEANEFVCPADLAPRLRSA